MRYESCPFKRSVFGESGLPHRTLTGCHIRMARACLNLSLTELANRCGVSEKTIRRCEAAFGLAPANEQTLKRLLVTFEAYGVSFSGSIETGVLAVLVDVRKCHRPDVTGPGSQS